MSKYRIQVTFGERFGQMVYAREAGYATLPSGQRHRQVLARCDCGQVSKVRLDHWRSGRTKSCGCLQSENMASIGRATYTHQSTGTPLHRRWLGLFQRCSENAEPKKRARYFEKGIAVCEEWMDFEKFRDWALLNGYLPGLTIDRKDGDKGYSPLNCRWANMTTQNENKRTSYYWHIKGSVYASARLAAESNGVGETTIGRWVRDRSDCWKRGKYSLEHSKNSTGSMGA